jgi:hypothetical protein
MTIVIFTPIELPNAFDEAWRWFLPAIAFHFWSFTVKVGVAVAVERFSLSEVQLARKVHVAIWSDTGYNRLS